MRQHTFVVLAHKTSPYLDECLKSLNEQSVPSSIIIATSTPSPFIEQIARFYGHPVRINPESRGIASDWNFGFAQANTPFVTLAHQDDLYDRSYTEKMLKVASQRIDNLITFSDYHEMFGNEVHSSTKNLRIKRAVIRGAFGRSRLISSRLRKKMLLSFGNPIPCPSVMYNRENLPNFSFSYTLSISIDWDAWINIALLRGSIACVKEPLLTHRIHAASETSRGIADKRRGNEDFLLFRKMWPMPIAVVLSQLYALSYRGNESGKR